MSNEITVKGFVGTEPQFYAAKEDGNDYCRFRVASAKKFLDKKTNEWRDGETVWFTVKAWRHLANNVSKSIKKADPVIVVGELTVDTWGENDQRQDLCITAYSIGHDLSRGTANFSHTNLRDITMSTDNKELQDMASVAEFHEVGA
jgi:single-strand DNA-binding protein